MSRFYSFSLWVLLALTAMTVRADVSDGYIWLEQQQVEGTIYSLGDNALKYQATLEALQLHATGFETTTIQSYIDGLTDQSTELLARRILSQADLSNVPHLLLQLGFRQNSDGGFGNELNQSSNNYDSYWVLAALADASVDQSRISQVISYLMDSQNSDGGWSYPESFSSVNLTGRIVPTLVQLRTTYPSIQETLNSAVGFLLGNLSLDLGNADKAIVLKALARAGASIDITASLTQNLMDEQLVNGSWNESVYTTSLVLQSIKAFELSSLVTETDNAISSIAGKVVLAGSSEPLNNVTITFVTDDNKSAVSGQFGEFTLSKLPLGRHTLLFSKSGYLSLTKTVSLTSGHTVELASIALQPAASGAFFSGVIYDDYTGEKVQGASIALSGSTINYSISTSNNGEFSLPSLQSGDYQITISAQGYRNLIGQLTLKDGEITRMSQGLVSSNIILDDSPVDLTGRVIDGETGLVISAAQLELSDGSVVASGVDGQFTIANQERGGYELSLSAAGYKSSLASFYLPAGASGILGDIALYKEMPVIFPTTLGLTVTVRDAVTKSVISGVLVGLPDANMNATTNTVGEAHFTNITPLSFTLISNAEGYLAQNIAVSAGGYGETALTLFLTPSSDNAEAVVNLAGIVTDPDGQPISGAKVASIVGADVVTGTDGSFSFTDIETLDFSVVVSAAGYESEALSFNLQDYGSYNTGVILQPFQAGTSFAVLDITPPADIAPYEIANFKANIQNLGSVPQEVVVRGQILGLNDEFIAVLSTLAPGTSVPQGHFTFNPGETLELDFNWKVLQSLPGTYRLQIDVVEVGSIQRTLPQGIVLARQSVLTEVTAQSYLDGGIQFEPPLIQAGSNDDVELKAIIRNVGNITLEAGEYSLDIIDDGGATLHTATSSANALAMNGVAELDFGTWLPTIAGHHQILIKRLDDTSLAISGVYYVGDIASATFTLAQQVFPEGDQTTSATINMQGIDVSNATVSDELFELVKGSVKKGGDYLGSSAVAWDKSTRCLGCHIQAQGVYGLASAQGFVDVDEYATNYLVGELISSAQADGTIRKNHNDYLKTQTGFALWALSEWDDKLSAFKAMYNASLYLESKSSRSGENVYWVYDYPTGWFTSPEGMTWAVAKGMADVVNTTKTQDIQFEGSWAVDLENTLALPAGGEILGLTSSDDGQSIYVSRRGSLSKFRAEDNTAEIIYTGASDVYDTVEFNNALYIVDGGDLVKIEEDGTQTRWGQPYRLTSLEVFNGELYGTAFYNNLLVKLNLLNNRFETAITSALINSPADLVATDDGRLLIANTSSYNVLQLDQNNELSIYASGLPYRPIRISDAGNGEYYVSTLQPFSAYLVNSDKEIEVILPQTRGADFYGYARVNDQSYTVLAGINALIPLNRPGAFVPDVSKIEAALQGVANTYDTEIIGSVDPQTIGNEITRLAFRLMTLAEAKAVVTDQTQLATINTVIDALAVQIRSYQHENGGWGRYIHSQPEPISTAIMGMALDYTDPSADDPVIRSAISYLLDTQGAYGGWSGEFFTTTLGTTGMVMAYLPRALQRLGGIDIGVNVSIPENVQLSNLTVAPNSVTPLENGNLLYNWDMVGVTANGQNIDFNVLFKDLLVNEARSAADWATLNFENSFNGEVLIVDVAVPSVTAATQLGLILTTDKSVYVANEDVNLTNLVSNIGPQFTDGTLRVEIRDAVWNNTIEALSPNTTVTLAQGESLSVTHSWNTGNTLAGSYIAHTQVINANGHVQLEVSQPFMVIASGKDMAEGDVSYHTSISTDKMAYQSFDQVQLNTRVRNRAVNNITEAVLAKITVTDPQGVIILSSNYVAKDMIANGLQDFPGILTLDDAATGLYTATVTLWNANVTEEITSNSTAFRVVDSVLSKLQGNVMASSESVAPGEALSCTDTVVNRSIVNIDGLELEHIVVSLETGDQLVEQTTDMANISAKGSWVNSRSINTKDLEEGRYSCVLLAKIDDQVLTLGYANFEITINVKLENSIVPTNTARWLILDNPLATENTSSSEEKAVFGGHVDIDTDNSLGGDTQGHVHEYDDKFDTNRIDFFNVNDNKLDNISAVISQEQRFVLVLGNAELSPSVQLSINGELIAVTTYDDILPSALTVYSLSDGVIAAEQLTDLAFVIDDYAMTEGGVLPTNTGDVRGNVPGKLGEWRNGALTLQAIAVDENGQLLSDLDTTISNGGEQGLATTDAAMLFEATAFWHWNGDSYHKDSWSLDDAIAEALAQMSQEQLEDMQQTDVCHVDQGCEQAITRNNVVERLMQASGRDYTIVTSANAFEKQFLSGEYSAYALLAKEVKLDKYIQQALTLAAYRGEGLIIGSEFKVDKELEDALGAKVKGHETSINGILITPETFEGQLNEVLLAYASQNRAKFIDDAVMVDVLAYYHFALDVNGNPLHSPAVHDHAKHQSHRDKHKHHKHEGKHHANDSKHCNDSKYCGDKYRYQYPEKYAKYCHQEREAVAFEREPAMFMHNYGNGQVLYIGFDLFAQAIAGWNDASPQVSEASYSGLWFNAMARAEGGYDTNASASDPISLISATQFAIVPLQLQSQNVAAEVDLIHQLILPEGLRLLNTATLTADAAAINTYNHAEYLPEAAIQTLPVYLQVLNPGSYTLQWSINYQLAPDETVENYEYITLAIEAASCASIEALRVAINNEVATVGKSKELDDSLKELKKVEKELKKTHLHHAVEHLMKANDKLHKYNNFNLNLLLAQSAQCLLAEAYLAP